MGSGPKTRRLDLHKPIVKNLRQLSFVAIFLLLILGFLLPGNEFPPVAASWTPDQEWENALALYKKKEYLQALPILQRLEENYPNHSFRADALFIQAQVLRGLHRWPEAAQVFARAREVHAKLADYALYYEGEAWQMAKEGKKSLEVWQRLIDQYPASLAVPPAELKMAEIYLQFGEYLRCAEISEKLWKKKSRQEISAQALIFLGQAQEGLGQWARAIETYQEVWLQYPLLPSATNAKSKWESLAQEKKLLVKKITPPDLLRRALYFYQARLYEVALSEIERLEGFPLPTYPQSYAGEFWIDELYFHRGMCLFFLKQYSPAIEAFRVVVRHSRNEGMAERSLFWTTRALFRLGRKEEALNTFFFFQKTYPQSPFMDRALYLKAQIFDEGGDIAQAIAIYRELAEKFPQSSLRFQARWQSGWLLFKNQEWREAIQAWDFLQTLHPHSPWPEKVAYWKGRALLALGRTQEAEENFQKLLNHYPTSYYSRLASNRGESFQAAKGFSAPLQDQPLGLLLEGKSQPPGYESEHLEKGRLLARMGLVPQAMEELEVAEEEGKKAEGIQKEISYLYREVGEYHRSALLVRRNFNLKPLTGRPLKKDQDLYLLAYPLGNPFWVNPYAQDQNLDPALLSAVILEESRFNPQALSVAGARGLMQIIPRTGHQIARRLKLHPFSVGLLFEPEMNLRLGSWYLAHLLQEFEGKEALALAAYNAGPQAVRDWVTPKNTLREDEFVENIPYRETRNYVIRVLSSARVYRLLYGFPPQKSGS
jgi:soluble lytic murein transglycosylase